MHSLDTLAQNKIYIYGKHAVEEALRHAPQVLRKIHISARMDDKKLRELIFRMVEENSTWGAPRIHGELKMLGFELSERTVLRWMRRAPRSPEPAKQWAAFLSNHREVIAAMDLFTVPALTFGVLSCFFVIAHDRQRILHWNVTSHP